jgi:hypothetical protein
VKNSDWFRKLPQLEQACVIEALEVDTHQSAVRLRGALAVVYLTIIYTVAGAVWSYALRGREVALGILGALVGFGVGLCARNVVIKQRTPRDAKAMQAITGLFLGGFGLLVLLAGLVFLVV